MSERDMSAAVRRPAAARWADLRLRIISAVAMAPGALLCVWVGGWAWSLLLLAVAAGLGGEWAAMCGRRSPRLPRWSVPGCLLVAVAVAVSGHGQAALLAVVAGSAAVWGLSRRAMLAAGVAYLGVPLVALIWLRGVGEAGRPAVLFVIAIVWASDIGAYVAGRLLGGRKLAPAISPGKTWSGAGGGLLSAVVVGEAAALALAPGLAEPGRVAAAAGLLGAAAQAGDLFESWVKRRFGVKDSGWLIPGHGGLLDRLDGLLAAAPVAACLAVLMGRGGASWT